MEEMKIAATESSPFIHFDPKSGIFQLKGKSFPENIVNFYKPVLDWLENYIKNPNDKTLFEFEVEYFNSASTRIIVEIILHLEELLKKNKEVEIKWISKKSDRLMKELGEEIKDLSHLEFEKIKKD